MILINVKYKVKPEKAEDFLDAVAEFTQATRSEPGNLWFEWYRAPQDPTVFLLVEAFKDDAGEAHVNSEHFAKGLESMKPFLVETTDIVSRQVEGEGWDKMGEFSVD